MSGNMAASLCRHVNLFDHRQAGRLSLESQADARGGLGGLMPKLPPPIRANAKFYAVLFASYVAIFLTFAVKSGAGVRPEDNVPDIQSGGLGGTFLELPPQYDFEKSALQSKGVPFLYGIMHTALYSLGLLPLAMCRGFHRDLFGWPLASRMLPLTKMEFLHRLLGCMALGAIMLGALLWFLIMGISCFAAADSGVAIKACAAFNPNIADAVTGNFVRVNDSKELLFDSISGASYFDPRDNVLFLREVVWIVWFFCLPLILLANSKPPGWLPSAAKRLWWEICVYVHEFGGWITVLCALCKDIGTMPTWNPHL